MAEEENPFLITPKKAHKDESKTEMFGTDEDISFMVDPSEKTNKNDSGVDKPTGPHWESSGTPVWDKKKDAPKDEIVDHS